MLREPGRRGPASSASGSRVTSRAVPGVPGAPAVRLLQGHEEREVVEPGRALLAEGLEGLALRGRRLLLEAREGLREQRPLEGDHRPEVHLAFVHIRPPAPGRPPRAVRPRPSCSRLDQQRVPREGREALVRRVSVAGGPEGQDLPEPLPCLLEEVQESPGFLTELADAVRPGEARRVEEDTRDAARPHDHVTGTGVMGTRMDWLMTFPRSSRNCTAMARRAAVDPVGSR